LSALGPELHRPAFPDDDGSADPTLARCLRDFAGGEVDGRRVVEAVLNLRLIVPVVAVLGEVATSESGLTHEKTSDMATVMIEGRDGRLALPVFTCLDSLSSWRPDARPVAVRAVEAARAALSEGADALVLDIAGPVSFAVEGPALRAVAEGRHWLAPYDDPAIHAAIEAGLAGVDGIQGFELVAGDDADLLVILLARTTPRGGPDVELARKAAAALADDAILRSRLELGLAFAVLDSDQPA
jgi:hypothetical protein